MIEAHRLQVAQRRSVTMRYAAQQIMAMTGHIFVEIGSKGACVHTDFGSERFGLNYDSPTRTSVRKDAVTWTKTTIPQDSWSPGFEKLWCRTAKYEERNLPERLLGSIEHEWRRVHSIFPW